VSIVALETLTWCRIDSLPTETPSPHGEDSAESILFRERLGALLASLVGGEAVVVQVALARARAVLGVGLVTGDTGRAKARIHDALDGLVSLTDSAPEPAGSFRFTLTPTPADAAPVRSRPWPSAGVDLDGLLSSADRMTGAATVTVILRQRAGRINAVGFRHRLARLEARGPLPPGVEDLRASIDGGELAYELRIEATATRTSDLDLLRRSLVRGFETAIQRADDRFETSEADAVLRGGIVFSRQALGLLPIGPLTASSTAPVSRRAVFVGSSRPVADGDLLLGTGRGGRPIGIPRSDIFQHLGIYGETGFGKTNAMQALLRAVAGAGVPFLMVDPIKSDYEELLVELSERGPIQYLELGAADSPPINPLAAPRGVDPLAYGGVFAGAFVQTTGLDEFPLGEALLRSCVDRVYTRHVAEGRAGAPTLAQLSDEIERVDRSSDRGTRTAREAVFSLRTRLRSVTSGRAGHALLGGPTSGLDWDAITATPTLISLRAFADPVSRNATFALVMASFLAYRAQNVAANGHLTVIEEAHALFPGAQEGRAGLLGELLSTALASMRGQREGFALVTQSPEQLPKLVRDRPVTRLAARMDEAARLIVAPDQPDVRARLAGLGRGEMALWSASGDPQVAFFRSPEPAQSVVRRTLPRGTPTRHRYHAFSEAALDSAAQDDAARVLGERVASQMTASESDIGGLVHEALLLGSRALAGVPDPVTAPWLRAVVAHALNIRLAHDPTRSALARELAASARYVATSTRNEP
jgi:DNA helicase HerA-like ATPase